MSWKWANTNFLINKEFEIYCWDCTYEFSLTIHFDVSPSYLKGVILVSLIKSLRFSETNLGNLATILGFSASNFFLIKSYINSGVLRVETENFFIVSINLSSKDFYLNPLKTDLFSTIIFEQSMKFSSSSAMK